MSAVVRVGLFAVGLAVVFGGAFLVGGTIDPDVDDGGGAAHADGAGEAAHGGDSHRSGAGQGRAATPARVVVSDRDFEPGTRETLAFRIVDRDGRTVEDFDVEHERAMHLIAVRRDLTGYQHVHPRPDGRGGWTAEIDFPEAGPHRVYADFVTRGERRFTVTRDGRPVDDVEPYVGARGHLVALAERDLAFEHVHPKDRATEGREIRFDVALRNPGRYRLFLQFKHAGEVRTAAFTERVDSPARDHGEDGHGH